MKIKQIEIKNFRGIDSSGIKLQLSNDLNVFAGINGAGKTTILDAIAISLSWLLSKIEREDIPGIDIPGSSIRNGASYASIDIDVEENKRKNKWKIVETARLNPIAEKSDLSGATKLAAYFQGIYRDKSTLPVVVYYGINRGFETASPNITGSESIEILDVYKNALDGKTNYKSFFEWFRLQDDIANEQALSRTNWMVQNKEWLKDKTTKLISLLEKMNEENDNEQDSLKFGNYIAHFKKDELIYDAPPFLISELIKLIRRAGTIYNKKINITNIFQDIDDLFYGMAINSVSYPRTEESQYIVMKLEWVTEKIGTIKSYEGNDNEYIEIVISFIWESLLVSIFINLWWLSEKTKSNLEMLFSQFNPVKNNDINKFILSLNKIIQNDPENDNASGNEGRELQYVTETIENFVHGYTNLRVTRVPRLQMLVDKDGETFNLDQLSDGEKNLIALVGDIARRLAIANSNSSKPMEGEGIILIDEIDLHLHPSWQRLMIPKLLELFPNCQFFITTHSPQVLSHVHARNIFLLKNEKNVLTYSKANESYGQNSDRILEDLMDVDARPAREKKKLHTLFELIQDGDLEQAKKKAEELSHEIEGREPEIVKAEVLIKRKEIIGK